MKKVKIFLASSINDLHLERMEIGNFIRSLNDRFLEQGIYIQLCMCEDISDALAQCRKQDEFNDMIRDSDYFFIMFWHKAGAYTVEEFEVALQHFRETNSPKIMTYFKVIEDGDCAEQAVMDFMKRLESEFEHFHSSFVHTDTIKLKLLTILSTEADACMRLTLRDGKLWMNDAHLPSFYPENLPFYRNHEAINRLRIEIAELESALLDARLEAVKEPSDTQKWNEITRISIELNQKQEELHEFEMKLLETSMRLTKLTTDGSYITPRTKKAIELFEMGDVERALAMLDQEAFEADLRRAEDAAEIVTHQMEALVKELTTKIDILKSQGVTKENEGEIRELYEKARTLTLKHGLKLDCVVDYMSFLMDQNDYTRALQVGDQLYHEYKSRENTSEKDWARFCNNLANLYKDNQKTSEAEKLYREALEIYRRLAAANPAAYEPAVAMTCNNLANLYSDNQKPSEAEKLYQEALEIYRRLAAANPAAYEPDVAMTCNNLAILYKNTRNPSEAEKLYQEALEIYRCLAAANPAAYEPAVAMTCNNLANLYSVNQKPSEAEKLYLEALEIRRRLAAANPAAYESNVADTCNNLANLYKDNQKPSEAETLYQEALEIRRRLAAANPAAYEAAVAMTCYNLAILYMEKDPEKADALLKESFPIAKKYKDTNYICSQIYESLKAYFE